MFEQRDDFLLIDTSTYIMLLVKVVDRKPRLISEITIIMIQTKKNQYSLSENEQ